MMIVRSAESAIVRGGNHYSNSDEFQDDADKIAF
jgi:hypothetical protein